MASPDGLRLYLGKNVPAEVLDIIFSYGYHLWLSQPWEVSKVVCTDRTSRYNSHPTQVTFNTTVRVVRHWQLDDEYTQKLVGYKSYFKNIMGGMYINDLEPVSPAPLRHQFRWLRDGGEWYYVCDPPWDGLWEPWRFPPPEPSALPSAFNDDAELEDM